MTKMKTNQLRCITSTAPLLHQTQENQDNNIKMQCQVLKTNLWIKAIKEEIRNFFKCNVQKKVPWSITEGKKPLGNRWVFKKKSQAGQICAMQSTFGGERVHADTRRELNWLFCPSSYRASNENCLYACSLLSKGHTRRVMHSRGCWCRSSLPRRWSWYPKQILNGLKVYRSMVSSHRAS